MNSGQFWSKRFSERFREMLRYARYMLNDHFLLVLLIAIGGGAYYYKDWVAGLDETFPTAIIFAVVFAFILTSGTVITFLKEADKVFLLPLETDLKPYFIRSFILSFIWQAYWLFMVTLVAWPIYLSTIGDGFLYFFVALFVLKAINLWTRWNVDYDPEKQTVTWDFIIRYVLNGIVIFLYLKDQLILFSVALLILMLYSIYFYIKTKNRVLPWERLIYNEEKRMGFFYRLANLFTDVPHLKNRVKRRLWLDILLPNKFSTEQIYKHLFTRTFFRSGDYFGLFLRLTIIGGFLVLGLAGSYLAYAIAVLFIYLTGFQLLSLWKHYDAILWPSLYPVNDKLKKSSFIKLMLNILWTQNLLFTLLFITSLDLMKGFFLFVILSVFTYAFVYLFVKKRIEKWESQ